MPAFAGMTTEQAEGTMVTKQDMVGVYRQTGEEVVDASGKVIHSDSNRSSQIMYSADGYVGVVSTPNGRKKLANAGGRDADGDLLRGALRGEGRRGASPCRDGAQRAA
jgi:hypothetical protein